MNPQQIFEQYREHAARLYSAVLADVLDTLGHRDQVLPAEIAPLDPSAKMFGKARTLRMKPVHAVPAEPYKLEIAAIDGLHSGDVLVIAMSGCPACAVWGELLSTAAQARGAAGVVMDGPTRDIEKILEVGFPTFAAGHTPLDSKGRADGDAWDEPVQIGPVIVKPGDLVFGDRDGVVAIPIAVAGAALEAAVQKATGENTVRAELAAGKPVGDVFAKFGIL